MYIFVLCWQLLYEQNGLVYTHVCCRERGTYIITSLTASSLVLGSEAICTAIYREQRSRSPDRPPARWATRPR